MLLSEEIVEKAADGVCFPLRRLGVLASPFRTFARHNTTCQRDAWPFPPRRATKEHRGSFWEDGVLADCCSSRGTLRLFCCSLELPTVCRKPL